MPGADRDHRADPDAPEPDPRVDQGDLVARLAEELRVSEDRAEMLARVVADGAHDVSARLTAIAGYGQLLQHDGELSDTANDLEQIVLAAGSAARVTHRLLSVTGYRSFRNWEGPIHAPGRCDLAQIVADAVAHDGLLAPRIRLRIIHAPVTVGLSADRATQLIRALLSAAASATDDSAPLDVELRVVPPPGSRRALLVHARLRLAVASLPGVMELPREWQQHRLHDWFDTEAGELVTEFADGQVTMDWWLPVIPERRSWSQQGGSGDARKVRTRP